MNDTSATIPSPPPSNNEHQEVLPDITSRSDIEQLVQQFYDQALYDDLLFPHFAQLRNGGMATHFPNICNFWEKALLRTGIYRGDPLSAHQKLHELYTLEPYHFARWIEIWNTTIDSLFSGKTALHAKQQAARIAWALYRRITGNDSPQLRALLTSIDPTSLLGH